MHQAGFFVSTINPLAVKDYQNGITVRKVKTDKADTMKITQFAIEDRQPEVGGLCGHLLARGLCCPG